MIVASAYVNKEGKILTGRRHNEILMSTLPHGCLKNCEDGFVTDEGVFLDRKAAAKHALECGQITELHYGSQLYSEDLW